jgi:hypothetical protein
MSMRKDPSTRLSDPLKEILRSVRQLATEINQQLSKNFQEIRAIAMVDKAAEDTM